MYDVCMYVCVCIYYIKKGKCVSVSALVQLLQLWRSSVAALLQLHSLTSKVSHFNFSPRSPTLLLFSLSLPPARPLSLSFSLSLCLCLSFSFFLYFLLCLSLFLSPSPSPSLCLSVSSSFFLPFDRSPSLPSFLPPSLPPLSLSLEDGGKYVYVCMCVRTYACVCVCMSVCMLYMYIYVCIYIYTHTARSLSLFIHYRERESEREREREAALS